jgi:hypothetical protein
MKKLLLVVALVVLAFPATAPAQGAGGALKSPAKECKALRAKLGAEAFKSAFRTHGRCVSAKRKARKAALKRARRACRTKGFRGRALKRCMRNKLASTPAPKPADYEHAVDECTEEQAQDPEGFAAEYGEGQAGVAKCVAEEAADEEEADEPGDDEELEPGDGEGTDEPGDGEDVEDSPDESGSEL